MMSNLNQFKTYKNKLHYYMKKIYLELFRDDTFKTIVNQFLEF